MPSGNPRAGEFWYGRVGHLTDVVYVTAASMTTPEHVTYTEIRRDLSSALTLRDFLATYQHADLSADTLWFHHNEPRTTYRIVNPPSRASHWYVQAQAVMDRPEAHPMMEARQVELFLHHCLPTRVRWDGTHPIPHRVLEDLRHMEAIILEVEAREEPPSVWERLMGDE